MWIFKHVVGVVVREQAEWDNQARTLFDISRNGFKDWLFFAPIFTMCLTIDLQFFFQVKNYKPVSFMDLPFKGAQYAGYFFAVCSLVATICGMIVMYYWVKFPKHLFTSLWIYNIFLVKAVCWSPWVGWEYYDMFFEHLYYDTQYQLN